MAVKEVQADCAIGICMFGRENLPADFGRNVEFLAQFPCEAGLVRFVGLALAAGELPMAGQMRVLEAAGHQISAVAFDDGCDDDDRRRINAH